MSDERQDLEIGKGKSTPGSFSDLIAKYYQSPEFNSLAPITQRTYRNDIERFRIKHGDKSVAGLTTDHIEKLIAEKADRPAAANRLRKTLKILMAFAVKKKFRADNPTVGIKKLKSRSTGFRTWNE